MQRFMKTHGLTVNG